MTIQETASAIVALINAKPTSPTQAEIEAILARTSVASAFNIDSPLVARALAITARVREAAKLDDGAACDAAIDEAQADMQELDELIPRPPRSFADLVARAQIAYAGAEVRDDGTMVEADNPDIFEGPAARLVEAVLQFAE